MGVGADVGVSEGATENAKWVLKKEIRLLCVGSHPRSLKSSVYFKVRIFLFCPFHLGHRKEKEADTLTS